MTRRMIITAGITCAMAAVISAARSQEPKDESKKSEWHHEAYLNVASGYSYFLDESRQKKLELRREPVMRWSSDGDFNGEVYVWTNRGAPGIVGCIFSGPQGKDKRGIYHEFHSLAPGPLFEGEKYGSGWLPQEPGVELAPILEAPEPAATATKRLAQIRDLSRRFSAQVAREGGKSEIRLLTQHLYRYEVEDEVGALVDGALLAFVWTTGTDPEAIVAIEARRTDAGIRWYYSVARFTNCEAWVRNRDKQVWHADPATAGIFDGVTTKRYGAYGLKTITVPTSEK